jgi:hypothetical protein
MMKANLTEQNIDNLQHIWFTMLLTRNDYRQPRRAIWISRVASI